MKSDIISTPDYGYFAIPPGGKSIINSEVDYLDIMKLTAVDFYSFRLALHWLPTEATVILATCSNSNIRHGRVLWSGVSLNRSLVRQVFRLSMVSIWPTGDAKYRGDTLSARYEFKHKL